jgi:predicted lipoprotein with Yx(FWY)xxD motif
MKRCNSLLAGALIAAVSATGVADAHPLKAHKAEAATVQLRETSLGKILVNSSGLTLFEFTKDKKNKDECVTISGCAGVWPALEVSGTPSAGEGVDAKLLGTITLPGGAHQVTYDHHPLYGYVGESNPGETSYVGAKEFGGTWYALSAKAKKVKQATKGSGW